jgi:hypothetical protein
MEADSGPVVVGGVGGSGTRLIAEMLQRVGIHLGLDLNSAKDNLWFTLLFRRPQWFERALESDSSQVVRSLSWFEDAMLGRLRVDDELRHALADGVEELVAQGLDRAIVQDWCRHFVEWGTAAPEARRWGWKEPNSHIYIKFLAQHFGDRIHYIHVIRDGIALARRGNYRQLQNWGGHFGVPFDFRARPSDLAALRSAFLDYWIAANRRALLLGPRLFGPRFLVMNLDHVRTNPTREVVRLLEHLDLDASPHLVSSLSALPEPPADQPAPSDYSGLTEEQRRGFAELGIDIPAS